MIEISKQLKTAMLQIIIRLVLAYSFLAVICVKIMMNATAGLTVGGLRLIISVLFCAILSLALFHIRHKIGNNINYLRAVTCSFIIGTLAALWYQLIDMAMYLYIKPIDTLIISLINLSGLAIIPGLVVSIFFRKSNKVISFKRDSSNDILDSDL